MKHLKNMVVLAVLAAVMMVLPVEVKATNYLPPIVWEQGYGTEKEENYEYPMTLQQSGRVTFVVNITYEWYSPEMTIKDISGNQVWRRRLENGTHTFYADLLAGDYIITFNGVESSWTPAFTPSGETVYESYLNKNDQLGLASGYTFGQSVNAQLAENDDSDIYKVDVRSAGYLTMKINSMMTKFDMSIAGPDGVTLFDEYGVTLGESSYKYYLPEGTYYVMFKKNGHTGTYTFCADFSGVTATKLKSVKNIKTQKVKVIWTKISDVDGYQVQIALNNKFTKGKKIKTITDKTRGNYTFTKLKKRKTYYVRVRTYKLVNGKKAYSDWSAGKKVKVRK